MKVRVNVELEATDAELRDLAVDVAHRAGTKLIVEAAKVAGPSMPAFGAMVMDILQSMKIPTGGPMHAPGCPCTDCNAAQPWPPPGCRPDCPPFPHGHAVPVPGPAHAPTAPEPPVAAQEPPPDFSAMKCGDKCPGDTVEGVMWTNMVKGEDDKEYDAGCPGKIAYVVSCPQFGNRGVVRRVCCDKHMNYLTGSGMPCVVAGIPQQ